MPLSISTDAISEKNKLANSDPWILLLEIIYPNETPVRVAWNTENVVWDGVTWYAVPFELGDMEESREAEVPTVDLTIVDIERRITPYIDDYNGGVGATVYVRVVHSAHLDNTDAELEEKFEIRSVNIDHRNAINFSLGSENLSNFRSPPDIFLQAHCRYKEFKGTYCQYSGSETDCDRTFEDCRSKGNESRFGGFPGIGVRSYWE